MIIEIVAGRILAPSIGVSLYTWTSVIGVVLAGFSTGNYFGGRVADRFPSLTTLGFILLASSISSLSVLLMVGPVSGAFLGVPFLTRVVFLTATLFFLPSFILGMVTPVVIKLSLQDLARTGTMVGSIYAISTAGSIFGTFITGFVLIQWIGTRPVLLLVSLVLLIMALAFGNVWRARVPGMALLVVFAGLGGVSFSSGTLSSGCLQESSYYCIRVTDTKLEGGQSVKTLHLDALLHGYVSVEDPTFLEYGYTKVFADVASYVTLRNPSPRVLFLGGGGYTMPRYLETVYPQSTLEVIEIDPAVTRVAFENLGLRPDTRIVTYNQDARLVVRELTGGQYDLIVGDVFHDVSIPYHLTTIEFNEQILTLLNSEGIYLVNVIDRLHSGRFLRAYVNTLQETFPYVYVLRDVPVWDEDDRQTYLVASSLKPLSSSALQNTDMLAGRSQSVVQIMPDDTFEFWLNSQTNVLLTDDYAPVDNLLAPLLLKGHGLEKAEEHYIAGVELQRRGQFIEAIAEYDEAIKLNPLRYLAYSNKGTIFLYLGQYQQSIENYNKAISVNPQLALAYVNRGSAHYTLGQYHRAVEDFTEAIRINPRYAMAYANRAMAYTLLNMDADAQQEFDQAVILGFNPSTLKSNIEELKWERQLNLQKPMLPPDFK